MLAKHLDTTDASVSAWLSAPMLRAARPPASPSMSVAVHSGREMSSSNCKATSAKSMTSRRVPGWADAERESRLKSGSTTQRAGAVGSVGVEPSAAAETPSATRSRTSSGSVPNPELSRILERHDPRGGDGLASPRWKKVDGTNYREVQQASGSGASLMGTPPCFVAAPPVGRAVSCNASPPQLAVTCLWWRCRSGAGADAEGTRLLG